MPPALAAPPPALAPPAPAPAPAMPAPAMPAAEPLDDEFATARTGVRMSVEEFLGLPEDPTLDRWLVDGEVWEEPMTYRSYPHSACQSRGARQLGNWLEEHLPGGEVISGEGAVRLPDRETLVGVDAAILEPDEIASQPPPPKLGEGMHVFHGTPRLIVEVVSASDRDDAIAAKVLDYLAAGVRLVWVTRPSLGTLTVHRPDGPARTYAGDDDVPGGEALPGLAVRAGELFAK